MFRTRIYGLKITLWKTHICWQLLWILCRKHFTTVVTNVSQGLLPWFLKEVIKKWQFPKIVFAIMQLRDITGHLNRLKRLFHVCVHTDSFKRSVVPRVLPFVIRFFFNLGFDLFCNLLWTADNFAWRCFTFLLRQRVSTALFHIGKKRQRWSNKKNCHYADMCELQNWLSPFITTSDNNNNLCPVGET